jgi:hypothetical protein
MNVLFSPTCDTVYFFKFVLVFLQPHTDACNRTQLHSLAIPRQIEDKCSIFFFFFFLLQMIALYSENLCLFFKANENVLRGTPNFYP